MTYKQLDDKINDMADDAETLNVRATETVQGLAAKSSAMFQRAGNGASRLVRRAKDVVEETAIRTVDDVKKLTSKAERSVKRAAHGGGNGVDARSAEAKEAAREIDRKADQDRRS